MENLTLPEPAAGLWAAKRSIVHAIPPEMFGRSIPPHLGGGTILAARWKHRISTDIDVLLPGRNTLIDLLQDNDRNIINQLGGTPEAVAGGRVKIAFENGFLDISTFRPDPPPTATPSPPSTASSRRFSPATRSCAASSDASTSCSSATSSTS